MVQSQMKPRVVMVTGASRGIGRAVALHAARRGHHVILTARTVNGGAKFLGTTMNDPVAGADLFGSVNDVAEQCRTLGVRALAVPLDLTQDKTIELAAQMALEEFGVVDTLVSNAIYQGPGINDRFADIPLPLLRQVIEADAIAPLILLRAFLSGMVLSERGVYIHLTSGAASLTPKKPAGAGGWGLAYAMAKGAAHRVAGVIHVEYGARGVRAYNLNPGHVTTEVMRLRAAHEGRQVTGGSPDDVAQVAQWLIDGAPEAVALSGHEVISRDFVEKIRSTGA